MSEFEDPTLGVGEGDVVDPNQLLRERHRPGNWLAIEPDEEIPSSVEGFDRTIISMFQMLFTLEVRHGPRRGRSVSTSSCGRRSSSNSRTARGRSGSTRRLRA